MHILLLVGGSFVLGLLQVLTILAVVVFVAVSLCHKQEILAAAPAGCL